ncbi:hypothetical protein [Nocardioides taihuensis]|uniref:SMI1/KNR4 family protein n=1 Tax=Nocardioides taihuensis TaxID=1835606 RepID=A0ABW0BPN3_9ACTN
MDLDALQPTSPPLSAASAAEVAGAARTLGTRFPAGYGEFAQRFGSGAVGDIVRVYGPDRVVEMTHEWRERVREYWFWETEGTGVTREQLQARGVLVADTFNGDEVCFVDSAPDRCVVLPRDSDNAVVVTGGMANVLTWLLESGELVEPVTALTFDPFPAAD